MGVGRCSAARKKMEIEAFEAFSGRSSCFDSLEILSGKIFGWLLREGGFKCLVLRFFRHEMELYCLRLLTPDSPVPFKKLHPTNSCLTMENNSLTISFFQSSQLLNFLLNFIGITFASLAVVQPPELLYCIFYSHMYNR